MTTETESETKTSKVNLRDTLKALTSTGKVEITFVKKDGTDRTMICTTKTSNIPEEKQPVGESTLKENTDILRVYDIENEGWRSFRIDRVKSFTISN